MSTSVALRYILELLRADNRDGAMDAIERMIPQAMAWEASASEDAERYRKIKNSRSPFVVHYHGSKVLGGDINRREVVTPELDALIDSWPEEEHDV